ncbi:hypothetical protein SFA35_18235 [Pseudomonas sp. HR96]|uniref:hypothetical protein n=1 Tax=Pseudomonas sp. HR96 TaxID=1027966 RepID=UPI002A7480D2|nr:hypothetical protein [Pseudomonas sp. HR96]WPO98559.1 hypothetical protein SFA35_18235 [Pseudomonas sp. HR96]
MTSPLQTFLTSHHRPEASLYLLLDPLADCAESDPLHEMALRRQLGENALTRLPRPDLDHAPEAWPLLVTLAGPGVAPAPELLALAEHRVQRDRRDSRHYVCAWLSSSVTAEQVGKQLITLGHSFAPQGVQFLPLYQPLRFELLRAWSKQGDQGLGPLHGGLFPGSDLGYFTATGEAPRSAATDPQALDAQREVVLIAELLDIWRSCGQRPAPSLRSDGTNPIALPGDAAFQAYQQIRQARALGLQSADIQVLAAYRLLVHDGLPRHPLFQRLIAEAASGGLALEAAFLQVPGYDWDRAIAELDHGAAQ